MSRFNVNIINTEEEDCSLQSLINNFLDVNGVWSKLYGSEFYDAVSVRSTTMGENFNFYTSKTGWWCSYRNYDFIHLAEEKVVEILGVYESVRSEENESSDFKKRILSEEMSKFTEGRTTLELLEAIISNHNLRETSNRPFRGPKNEPRDYSIRFEHKEDPDF
jgi:hypothetical protein